MSAINVNSITGRTGGHGPVLTGVTTISGDLHVGSGISVTGISTISNVVVGGATTELVVTGDARVTGILTVGTSSLTLNGTDGTISGISTINGISYPSTGALSNRNLIINGAMTVAQRGTSATSVTGNVYQCDRFLFGASNLGTWTLEQSGDAPVGFSSSFKVTCTTADASPDAGDFCLLIYRGEARDFQLLNYGTSNAESVVISFYVKSNKTGSASFGLRQPDSATTRQFTKAFTINAADTWEYKTIVIPGDTSGQIDNDSYAGVILDWWLNSGSTYTGGTHATTWETLDQTNRNASNLGLGGAISDYFQITGVQMELGSQATPFEHRLFSDELRRCQRYFCKSSSYHVVAQDGDTYSDIGKFYTGTFNAYNSTAGYTHTITFPVSMRDQPDTFTVIPTNLAGSAGQMTIYDRGSLTWKAASVLANSGTTDGVGLTLTTTGSWATGGNLTYYAWTAEAEI